MKTSRNAVLVLVAVLALVVWARGATVEGKPAKPSYEYWAADGRVSTLMPGMKARLDQGFEVDRLEIAHVPMPEHVPQGDSHAYMVVVLKREKK